MRLDPAANSIGWLVWHLTRIQDDHVAAVAGTEQVWTADGWAARFDLPFDLQATGYGHGPDEVAAVRVTADLLTGYYDAVHERSRALPRRPHRRRPGPGDRRSWNPPVTLGVRLVSVICDDLQHVGQAAFVRGIVERA